VAGKANVLMRLDERARARAVLEPHVAAGTEDAGMAVVYARLAIRDRDLDRAVEIASRHVGDAAGADVIRSLWNEIGRAHEQAGRYDESFAAYARCNGIAAPPWDPAEASRRHDRVMEAFSAAAMKKLARSPARSDVPVFIVGQPRSGSTLIEQIIAAHPQAFGAGEVQVLAEVLSSMGLRIGSTLTYPDCVADLEPADAGALGTAYVDQLIALAPRDRARRICDKQLGNYEHLGAIALLLPGARIIHSRRDPLDTCLSCYSQKFAPGAPAYTRDLRHLGLLYNDYLALMAHWRAVLDIPMLEVDYEHLVADQESVSRTIIDFCGLPWDDASLRFHETGRSVLTLSRDQVNRPIYRTSLRRAERFAKHLGPLRAILDSGERGAGRG
jgi:tetratricopeptide (TPR) repeat protein